MQVSGPSFMQLPEDKGDMATRHAVGQVLIEAAYTIMRNSIPIPNSLTITVRREGWDVQACVTWADAVPEEIAR